jgi:RNA polymerase sigma-70 factor, ECF subfamily
VLVHRSTPDAVLAAAVRAYLRGDDGAFAVFYGEFGPAVRAYSLHLGCGERAEDVAQEVWLRLSEHRGRVESRADDTACVAAFRGWLFRVAQNVATDRQRRRRLEGHRLRPLCPGDDAPDGARESDPAAAAEAAETQTALLELIDRLPEDQRHAVRRFYLEDAPTPEIARELERSTLAVRHLLLRGRRQLGGWLGA